MCGRADDCLTDPTDIDTMDSDVLVLSDLRLARKYLFTEENLERINALNLTGSPLSWRGVQRLIYRFMLNPIEETIDTILQQSEQLGPKQNVLGLHIRSAGKLADRKERVAMITPEILVQIPQRIRRMIALMHVPMENVVIYLSTDSTVIERFLREIFADVRIVVYNPFRRGHTTGGGANYFTIQQAITDMFMIAQADTAMYTLHSGFSEATRSLRLPPLFYTFEITKSVVSLNVCFILLLANEGEDFIHSLSNNPSPCIAKSTIFEISSE